MKALFLQSSLRGPASVALLLVSVSVSAQAARFELAGGTVDGGTDFLATGTGESLGYGAVASGSLAGDRLSGGGLLTSVPSAFGGGALAYTWERSADLLAGSSAQFSMAGVSALTMESVGGLTAWTESSRVTLAGTLHIAGDGQAAGTPVRIDLSALSLLSGESTVPGATRSGSFELQVLEGSRRLVRWTSQSADDAPLEESLSTGFRSRIGADLTVQLSHQSAALREGSPYDVGWVAQGFSTDDSMVGEMNVSVVPEPASYALWLAGLVSMGWHLRRRR